MEKKKGHHRGRRKRRSITVSNIVLGIAVAVFLFSGYKLYTILSEYNKGNNEYKKMEENVLETETVKDEETGETRQIFRVDFEKLKSINPDVVGWIRFDEPEKISYPIVRGKDNDKYLKTTVEGHKNSAGSIFMDAYNALDFTDRNTFLYGHNMKNGSMFGQLRKYKSFDFYKENPYFYIYTPDGKETKYQIYAVCIVEDTSESYDKFYMDDAAFIKYLENIKKLARYDTGVEVNAQSQLVSLSTCTNVTETQRLLVHGVKIQEPENEEHNTEGVEKQTAGEKE